MGRKLFFYFFCEENLDENNNFKLPEFTTIEFPLSLETLTLYNYPSITGLGRVPDKKNGERFKSEFFTRSISNLEKIFTDLICEILKKGWCCAWSYSDSGTVLITNVISEVMKYYDCKIETYAMPYIYKAQGGRKQKHVTEHLVLFQPGVKPR